MLAGLHMVVVTSAGLLFLPALTRCCSSHLWENYVSVVSAWPMIVKFDD